MTIDDASPDALSPGSVRTDKNFYRLAIDRLRPRFWQVAGLSALVNTLILTGPLYMILVYDQVLPSGSLHLLGQLFLIVITLFVLFGAFEWLRTRLLSRASQQLDQAVCDPVCETWLLDAIDQTQSENDPMRDLEVMRNFISSPAILALFDLPWIPIFLFVVFWIHPWLGVLTVAGATIVVIAAILNRRRSSKPVADAAQSDGQERAFIRHAHRDAETVLGLGIKENVIGHWSSLHKTTMSHFQKGSHISEYFAAFSKGFRLFLQSALLTTGAVLAIQQQISFGAIIAVSVLAGRVLAPLDHVIGQWRTIGRALSAHGRLCTLKDLPPQPEGLNLPSHPITQLRVNAASKSAPTHVQMTRPRILNQVNLSLQAGDALCVIGNSGAGKTSLARLLVGIWTPDEGEVLLGGVPVGKWRDAPGPRNIGYLPQRVDMLPGTIAQNISGFETASDQHDVALAARVAGIHHMIQEMPAGYQTRIGLGGYPLSGGQIQRLGLARAVFGQPRLIVLDEPNSNLDSAGNDALFKAIRDLRERGCIIVIMAHRPSVVEAGNKVMFLHQGRVIEQGDRDEVLRKLPLQKQAVSIPNPQRRHPEISPVKRHRS